MIDSATDVAAIRQELPSLMGHIYLNAASFGPLLRCVPEAMDAWLQKESRAGRLGMATYETIGELFAEARSMVAAFLNADADEIALMGNTGEGLNVICQGLTWRPGDEVIMTDHEHISLLIVLNYIRDRYGVVIRVAHVGPEAARPAEDAIAELITPRTRLIVLSHVSFLTGAVLHVRAVAELAHRSDILVLVDGAQSAGVLPIDVKALGVDAYAFPMQKWLCGPDGTGALYVRHEALEQIRPTYVGGWFSLAYNGKGGWDLHSSARRYEQGGRHTAAVAGQIASLRWLETVPTYAWIFERTGALNRYAYEAIHALAGVRILTPQPGASGLLAFALEGCPVGPLASWLQTEQQIHIRAMAEHNILRISTGFYTTEDELDCLAQALQKGIQEVAAHKGRQHYVAQP